MTVRINVLIVENTIERYTRLLDSFQDLLPMGAFLFTHVDTLSGAVQAFERDWDIILMDFHLGRRAYGKSGSQIDHGADLIRYRRSLEASNPERKRAQIIGVAANPRNGLKLTAAGANFDCCGEDETSKHRLIKQMRTWLPEE